MIGPGPGTRIFLASGATDLRKSFDGLCGLIASRMEEDVSQGHLYLFCNRQRTRLKVVYFDGSGVWVCAKRLGKGRFSWPEEATGVKVKIDSSEMAMLLGGLEMHSSRRKRWWRKE